MSRRSFQETFIPPNRKGAAKSKKFLLDLFDLQNELYIQLLLQAWHPFPQLLLMQLTIWNNN